MEAWIIEEQDAELSSYSQQLLVQPPLTQLTLNLPPVTDSMSPIKQEDVDAAKAKAHPAPGSAVTTLPDSYLGQINDRIDRAWLRPRVAIGAPEFYCRVRIDQDANGAVQKVALEECDNNVRWQLSLLNAIRTASPLPTPTDPSLFRSTLHMVFKSTKHPM